MNADNFTAFDKNGYAKAVWNFSLDRDGETLGSQPKLESNASTKAAAEASDFTGHLFSHLAD